MIAMIPKLISYPDVEFEVLPEGIHTASLQEVEDVFTFSDRRVLLFNGLLAGALALSRAGCKNLYLDGSYVTSKSDPGDYDAAWDPEGVNIALLDPVFAELDYPRLSQKNKFQGEFLPTDDLRDEYPTYMVDFFQNIRFSQVKKGVLLINPLNDILLRSSSL